MKLVPGVGLIATSARTIGAPRLHRPTDLAALTSLLRQEPDPVFVAGGTDLCARVNEGLAPDVLVSLDRIASLRTIYLAEGQLCIGSGVTHGAGSLHPLVRSCLPGFADAWARIANVRVRGWATIGGNLMARRTRYEMSILLSALGATIRLLQRDGSITEASPAALWGGAIAPGTLLHHVAVPLHATLFHYDRTLRPRLTLAVCRDARGARAVLATEWLAPIVLPVTDERPEQAAADAIGQLPESYHNAQASHWYLRQAGEVLLRRVLAAAHG